MAAAAGFLQAAPEANRARPCIGCPPEDETVFNPQSTHAREAPPGTVTGANAFPSALGTPAACILRSVGRRIPDPEHHLPGA